MSAFLRATPLEMHLPPIFNFCAVFSDSLKGRQQRVSIIHTDVYMYEYISFFPVSCRSGRGLLCDYFTSIGKMKGVERSFFLSFFLSFLTSSLDYKAKR